MNALAVAPPRLSVFATFCGLAAFGKLFLEGILLLTQARERLLPRASGTALVNRQAMGGPWPPIELAGQCPKKICLPHSGGFSRFVNLRESFLK